MSTELVNYSTGTTVTSTWLNRVQLREEALASYLLYQTGGTVYAKALTPGGLDYSGTNTSTILQNVVTALTNGGRIFVKQGTYQFPTAVTLVNNLRFTAEPNTVFQSTGGDILQKTGGISNLLVEGIIFDINSKSGSGINLIGSDATTQVTNFTLRNCQFKNPGNTWSLQVIYTIVDPTIPASKNSNIRIADCLFDATGQTGSLDTCIISNSQDVVIANSRFINQPSGVASALDIYGYNRNVKVVNCHFQDWNSNRAIIIQQSDRILVADNSLKTGNNQTGIGVLNSSIVDIRGNTVETGNGGNGIGFLDSSGTTFDGHTNLNNFSSNVKIQNNHLLTSSTCVLLNVVNVQGQTDIFVEGNMASPLRNLFQVGSIPASPSATIKRLFIRNNHVVSHSAISPNGCIDIIGNASAPNGGIQTVVISGNLVAASGSTGGDISIENLADDVTIDGNRLLSSTQVTVAAAVTNLRGSAVIIPKYSSTGNTGAVTNAINYTPPATAGTYRLSASVDVTAWTTPASFTLVATYKDASGNARTETLTVSRGSTGATAAAITAIDRWYAIPTLIQIDNSATAITLSTAGTFTGSPVYNLAGILEQVAG